MSSTDEIGGIVRRARERARLPREDLALAASVEPSALADLEEGRALLSTAKLHRIATVVGLDPLALIGGREVTRSSPSLFFRQGGVPDFYEEDLAPLSNALDAGRALRDVSTTLGRPASLRSTLLPEAPGPVPYEDGYHAARRARVALKNTVEPLGDLRALLEDRLDVAVCVAGLRTPTVFAVTVKEPGDAAAAVVLNRSVLDSSEQPLTTRVTLAHEMAHTLLDEHNGALDIVVDRDDTKETHGASAMEQRAKAFAAELLMPLHGLKKRFGDPVRIATPGRAEQLVDYVRRAFFTPAEITVNHLMNHGYLLKDETFRQQLIAIAALRPLPDDIPATSIDGADERRSVALVERVRQAHDRGLVTDGRARELLGLAAGDGLPWDATR